MVENERSRGLRPWDDHFFLYAVIAYGAVALIITGLAALFLQNIWMLGDTKLFFRMAEVIITGGTPYVDFRDPKPPLIFFTLALPTMLGHQFEGGLLLAGLCNFLSALLIFEMGRRLYGPLPGFAAGLIFLVNMALAEGFFIMTEPFTLLFILLSIYALLFKEDYLLSGIFAGVAVGFKQYALLLAPLALFYLYRKKELRRAPELLAGILIPLAIIFGAVFAYYGVDAGMASLYWSFGVADTYFTQAYIGDIPAYMAPSIGVALANVLLECGLFASLLVLAAASVLLARPISRREEYFIISGIAFLSLLIVRQYLHYWALALPFTVLLCIRPLRPGGKALAKPGTSYVALAPMLFAALIGVFLAIEYVIMESLWKPLTILSYYSLADPAAKMIMGIVGGETGLPPLLFSISPPVSLPWGLLVVGFLALASALIVTKIGMRSYGTPAGLLSGVLFTISIVWVLGYLTVADSLALALVLLSAYFIARGDSAVESLASGICAGAAACFGLFALVIVPVSVFLAWKRKTHGYFPVLAGALMPLVVMAGLDFVSYGSPVHGLALDSGLAFAGISISGSPYRTADAIMIIANIVLALCLFTALVPMAVAGFAARKRRTPADYYFLLAGICFILSFLLKEYLYYWFMALPFMALLCGGLYRDKAQNKVMVPQEVRVPPENITFK